MPSSESSKRKGRSATAGSHTTGGPRFDPSHQAGATRFTVSATTARDSATVSVLGAYWIRANWELSAATLSRAEKAFGRNWSRAVPVLRVLGLSESETTAQELESQIDVPVPGDAREWFAACPSGTRVEVQVGYLSEGPDGRFFPLAVSDPVPIRATSGPMVSPDGEQIAARDAGRTHSTDDLTESGLPDEVIAELQRLRTGAAPFSLSIEAELVLRGTTGQGANVCIGEAVVAADSDGNFEFRHTLENGRTVLPIDARSSTGKESRAGVASADFNLRVLEEFDE